MSNRRDHGGARWTRRQSLRVAGVTSLGLLAGCGNPRNQLRPRVHNEDADITSRTTPAADPWPTIGHDIQRTNAARKPGPTADASIRKFRAAKTFPQTQPVVTSEQVVFPGVVEGSTVGSEEDEFAHRFEAIHLDSKETVWTVETSVHPAPALVAGRTAFCPYFDNIIAVDIRDGSIYWRYVAGSGLDTGSPAISDGTLFVPDGRSILALDAVTGRKRWEAGHTFEGNAVGVAVTDEVVLSSGGGSDDPLVAVNRRSGTVRWTAPSVGTALPVTDGDAVYMMDNRRLDVVAIADGSRTWARTDVDGSYRPAVANGTLYTPSTYENGQRDLLAIDTANGDISWRTPIGSKVLTGPPVVSADSVYVQTAREGEVLIVAYDRTTGERRAEWSLPMGVTDSLALGDDALYFLGQPERTEEVNQGGVYVIK